jgi:peptide/nickel transport system substrate-binding protein
MVKKVYATDDYTVVFELKYPSGAFIPALANPFNFIYPKRILEKDIHWFEKNILGSGPFIFVRHKAGALIEGRRNPNYHHEGKPYLEGFRAMFVKHQSARVQAIKEGRASIEFRGFPPRIRNRLLRSLKHLVKVQESDWNCGLLIVPNHKIKPFDDPRVRRALTLAIDRWGAPGYLSRIAIVRTVGGIVFPGHPLAATKKELEKIAGYWPDLKKSRIEARRLLREAGVPIGFTFKFLNRGVDQPYRVIGAWVANQWKEIGLNAEQWVLPTDAWLRTLQGKGERFDVGIDSFCNSVPNPLLEVAKFISDDRSGDNHGRYQDRILDELFDKMNRTSNIAEQRRLMRKFERRLLDEQAHMFTTLWWYRIVPYRSDLRGWRISPSHYLNQDLSNIWLKRKQK